MDIHKPKAAHSWREFLIEIGTIICGILIALSLEQAVEWFHRRGEVAEAREALRKEQGDNLYRLQETIRENHCLERQFDSFQAWADGGPKPPHFRFFSTLMKTNTWESAKTRAVPLMPLNERVTLAALYDGLGNFARNREIQIGSHGMLVAFQDLKTLNEQQRAELTGTLSQERLYTHAQIGNAADIIRFASTFGMKPEADDPNAYIRSAIDWVCGAANAPDPWDVPPSATAENR